MIDMTPWDVFEAMCLLGYHEFRIVFDSDRKEFGHRLQRHWAPEELRTMAGDPTPRPAVLREYGSRWVEIDHREPVEIEFSDPMKRGGNNQFAALRRLRNFMKQHGYAESSYHEEEFRKRITFSPTE